VKNPHTERDNHGDKKSVAEANINQDGAGFPGFPSCQNTFQSKPVV